MGAMKEKEEITKVVDQVSEYSQNVFELLEEGETSANVFQEKALGIIQIFAALKQVIPECIYREYKDFFSEFSGFCEKCDDIDFLVDNVDLFASSLQLLVECMDDLKGKLKKLKRCISCGKEVSYLPLSSYYSEMKKKYGVTYQAKSETLNAEEYSCPVCGASDRDRLILTYLKMRGLQDATEGTRLLQIAPSRVVENWIKRWCPQVAYESTDLFMDHVTFHADLQNMDMVADHTYDVIICSHILEHVQDDKKAMREMSRILKPNGQVIFLVPIDLNAADIDEEWGLSEEENWRRFGQGDYCRRYSKAGLIRRLEETFYVHSLGKSYFGEETFTQCGLTDTSTLYVLTKSQEISLDMAEEILIDEKLLEEGPLVSVILPCYNHEEFVAEVIESIINQSYKNIELLVADDGSSDNTAAIMKRYSSHFAKEFYFEKNEKSRGILLRSHARGKYIALAHSDDLWEKDKIALQVDYMEKHSECGCCLTWAMYIDDRSEEIDDTIFLKNNRSSHEWMRYFWEHGNALCNPSSLIRREITLGKYGMACRQLPDFFKWIELVSHSQIHIIPKVLVKMHRYQRVGKENSSAVSLPNTLRRVVEEGGNWLLVMRDMEDEFFKTAFRDLMINPEADGRVEIQCEKYFLMLNHVNPLVQHSALCYFFEIYNDVKECMKEKYHYTRREFEEDMIKKGLSELLVNS